MTHQSTQLPATRQNSDRLLSNQPEMPKNKNP